LLQPHNSGQVISEPSRSAPGLIGDVRNRLRGVRNRLCYKPTIDGKRAERPTEAVLAPGLVGGRTRRRSCRGICCT
jgi:hypothetical protein